MQIQVNRLLNPDPSPNADSNLISRANKSLKYYKKKYPNEFLNNKLKINYLYDRLFLYSMPVLGGTMTLLHYGSLFRSTSIGVWCLVLAYFLKQYINFIKIISIK